MFSCFIPLHWRNKSVSDFPNLSSFRFTFLGYQVSMEGEQGLSNYVTDIFLMR